MARNLEDASLRLARLQSLAAGHHRASVECARLARAARKMEDRILLDEYARRESELAAALERRASAWRHVSIDTSGLAEVRPDRDR